MTVFDPTATAAASATPPATLPGPGLSAVPLAALSAAVLQLYRGSRVWPSDQFMARALALLAGLQPHRAALWGSVAADTDTDTDTGAGTPLSLPGLYSHGLAGEVLAAALAGLGPPCDLSASHTEALARRRVELRLWTYGQADAQALAQGQASIDFLMPHLVETQRQNQLARASDDSDSAEAQAAPAQPQRGLALYGADGALQQIDEPGLALLRHEWPQWLPPRLPEALVLAFAAALVDTAGATPEPFLGQRITVRATRRGATLLLAVRQRVAVDALSRRQLEIALRYAAGATGPQIAAELGLSPSTVNNHLGVIFKRLGVANKVQLLDAVRAGHAGRV